METTPRLCLACSKAVKGRADKKFCNDYCRNAFNNKSKSEETAFVRQVTQALKKNRRILEELLGNKGTITQPKSKLISKGFQFNYHTHLYTNKKGDVYSFCFEYGYLLLEGDLYLIVKQEQ